MTERIVAFEGYYRFLSNFWPCEVHFEGQRYPSAEHAYQAAKTLKAHQRELIRACPTPGAAKRAGKLVNLRPDWIEVKDSVMLEIVRDKFTRSPELRKALLDTNSMQLEEGNWWGDRYWGICPTGTLDGLNKLGKILMQVREELRK